MLSCHVTFGLGVGGGGGVGCTQEGFGRVALEVHLGKRYENTIITFFKFCIFFQESGSSKSSGKSPYSIGTDSMHVCLVSRSYKCYSS